MTRRIYNANHGMRRSKTERMTVPGELIPAIKSEAYKQKAIKEFGEEIVNRLENEFPGRIWNAQAIAWLRELLKKGS